MWLQCIALFSRPNRTLCRTWKSPSIVFRTTARSVPATACVHHVDGKTRMHDANTHTTRGNIFNWTENSSMKCVSSPNTQWKHNRVVSLWEIRSMDDKAKIRANIYVEWNSAGFQSFKSAFACDELIHGKSIWRKNANKSESFAVDQLLSIATMIVVGLFP